VGAYCYLFTSSVRSRAENGTSREDRDRPPVGCLNFVDRLAPIIILCNTIQDRFRVDWSTTISSPWTFSTPSLRPIELLKAKVLTSLDSAANLSSESRLEACRMGHKQSSNTLLFDRSQCKVGKRTRRKSA
jgi:hypothetical protein